MPLLETPTLARIPASVIVAKRAPSTAADQTTQRSGASAYQSQFCASHGPAGALAAAYGRALGQAQQLCAPVERGDQLGLDPGAQRERLQLGASGACQRWVRASTRSPKRRTSSRVCPPSSNSGR